MIFNFNENVKKIDEVASDVCIIGGGVIGLYIADRLLENGFSVSILERGPITPVDGSSLNLNAVQLKDDYKGDKLGRSFGLGGTSSIWGGQLLPITRADISSRPPNSPRCWPIPYSVIEAYTNKVINKLFAGRVNIFSPVEKNTTKTDAVTSGSFSKFFEMRHSVWLPFSSRNFGKKYYRKFKDSEQVNIWLNAPVDAIDDSVNTNAARKKTTKAYSASGRSLTVNSDFVVICAGAIESTGILLRTKKIREKCRNLGLNFTDHISMKVGVLETNCPNEIGQLLSPTFENGIMRSPRFEVSKYVQKRYSIPSSFVHFSYQFPKISGFAVIKEILKSFQTNKLDVLIVLNLFRPRIMFELFATFFFRFYHRRLYYPKGTSFDILIDLEQETKSTRFIGLGDLQSGQTQKLQISWDVSETERSKMWFVAEEFSKAWRQAGFSKFGQILLEDNAEVKERENCFDVYHPTGTIPFGINGDEAVVDENLELTASRYTFVCSTAVFPSAGSANPTLTMLALGERLTDHLISRKFQ